MNNFNINTKFVAPVINREGTEYITDNYYDLIKFAMICGVKEKADELVNDVYINLANAEEYGDGYNPEYGDGLTTVKQFILSRVKKYALNVKYSTKYVEKLGGKESYVVAASADSASDDAGISLTGAQKAYMNAQSDSDDIEDAITRVDIINYINYCSGFSQLANINITGIFANLDTIAKSDVSKNIFERVTKIFKRNNDFKEAFTSVVQFALSNPNEFDKIIKEYNIKSEATM